MGRIPGSADGLGAGAIFVGALAQRREKREDCEASPLRLAKPTDGRSRGAEFAPRGRSEASLAMPTWRLWRLCRRSRVNPASGAGVAECEPAIVLRRRLRCRLGGCGGFAAAAA